MRKEMKRKDPGSRNMIHAVMTRKVFKIRVMKSVYKLEILVYCLQ